jgi:hypothetical protein
MASSLLRNQRLLKMAIEATLQNHSLSRIRY